MLTHIGKVMVCICGEWKCAKVQILGGVSIVEVLLLQFSTAHNLRLTAMPRKFHGNADLLALRYPFATPKPPAACLLVIATAQQEQRIARARRCSLKRSLQTQQLEKV